MDLKRSAVRKRGGTPQLAGGHSPVRLVDQFFPPEPKDAIRLGPPRLGVLLDPDGGLEGEPGVTSFPCVVLDRSVNSPGDNGVPLSASVGFDAWLELGVSVPVVVGEELLIRLAEGVREA
jgi:hypothetical protein